MKQNRNYTLTHFKFEYFIMFHAYAIVKTLFFSRMEFNEDFVLEILKECCSFVLNLLFCKYSNAILKKKCSELFFF